jgi:hypothetical protein
LNCINKKAKFEGSEKMDVGFIAVETFIPEENYWKWSSLYQTKEIIIFELIYTY